MRRRIFWATVAAAVLALTAGGVVAVVLTNRSIEESAVAELRRQADAIVRQAEARLSQRPPATALDRLREEGVRELLATAAVIGGHDYVEIIGFSPRRGIVIPEDSVLSEPLGLAELRPTGPTVTDLSGEVDGERVVGVARFIPLGNSDFTIGVVLARRAAIVAPTLVRGYAMAVAVAVVVVAIAASWISGPIGRRLRGMSDAAAQVADGDLTVRVEEGGGDEVSDLARSFNLMAADLEETRRRERDFLMNVSHDIRTPLTTIAGYAEALEDGSVAPDQVQRVAGVLGTQTARLGRLVEDLMQLSRLEAREFTLRPEPVDLCAHLTEVVEGFRPRAEAAGLRFFVEIGPTGIVKVDPDRVAQIAANLVENALRYTPEGAAVTVSMVADPEGAALAVRDTGPGIDADDVAHLFERLYVAERYRPVRPEGSGLGLSIVKELTDAMGGSVSVDSALGGGTTVRVWLPVSS